MRHVNVTKIIATLGPASSSLDEIRGLYEAGATIFRMNFSHGSHEDHAARINIIRQIESESGRPLTVLADLQGPKLRVGRFENDQIELADGATFRFDLDPALGTQTRVNLPHPEILSVLSPQDELLLDDGKLKLKVTACDPSHAECEVINGGKLSNNKGVNVPGVILPLSALTDKDRIDLDFALSQNVDWVALSFVQQPQDVIELKEIVQNRAWVMAKLEKPSAIKYLSEIVSAADGIMVARGDLGVEMPPETVPVIQRRILAECRKNGVPVVVATQMLDSMIENPTPTRAESSDVATAVYNGADAVMLSAETAAGKYPSITVGMMTRIIHAVQNDPNYWATINARRVPAKTTTPDVISEAARQMAESMEASAIVAYTSSGSTALSIARERPHAPIISLTPRIETARRLNLLWGVHSARTPDARDMEDMSEIASHQAKIDGFAKPQDRIVITAGLPFGTPGKTNLIRIVRI
ncbi:MAG: pyruvate kinase [Alphaproteobacteria bacterium]